MLGIARTLGSHLAAYLSKPLPGYEQLDATPIEKILAVIEPGDVLLVDGNSRISSAIKYLTQSTWSHSCLYMGSVDKSVDMPSLVEADLRDGVTLVPLQKYTGYNLRICRPVGLSDDERKRVLDFVEDRLGYRYDLKNIFDLMRYLVQNPAIPPRYRRQLITLGSGEPTRAICSTLIAAAFQSINYPILPRPYLGDAKPAEAGSDEASSDDGRSPEASIAAPVVAHPHDSDRIEYWQRHYTHFVPRDFDQSPYFRVVKPTLEGGFDFHSIAWRPHEEPHSEAPPPRQKGGRRERR